MADVERAGDVRTEQTSIPPAWLVLDTMADAIVDERWGEFDHQGYIAEWVQAKEGDFIGTRDDCVNALLAMERKGWLVLDWDAEPPEPKVLRAEEVNRA